MAPSKSKSKKVTPVKKASVADSVKHSSPASDQPMELCTPLPDVLAFDADEDPTAGEETKTAEKVLSPSAVASLKPTTLTFTPRKIMSRKLQLAMGAKKMSPADRMKKRNQVCEHVLRVCYVNSRAQVPEGATEPVIPAGYMIAFDTPATDSDWPSKKVIDAIMADDPSIVDVLGLNSTFKDWHYEGVERINNAGYNLRVFFAFIEEVEDIVVYMNTVAKMVNALPKIGRNRIVVAHDSFTEGVYSDWLTKDDTVELANLLCETREPAWGEKNPHAAYCFWERGNFPLDVAKRFGLPNADIAE